MNLQEAERDVLNWNAAHVVGERIQYKDVEGNIYDGESTTEAYIANGWTLIGMKFDVFNKPMMIHLSRVNPNTS